MNKNPFLNALFAVLYISALVLLINHFEYLDEVQSLLIPVLILSALVFSVATMAFLFFSYPVELYLSRKFKEGNIFFLKTLGTFGLVAVCIFVSIFFFG